MTTWADFIRTRQPEWTKVNGVSVLRVSDSRYAAVPATNRKDAANWIALDVFTREEVCVLRKREVRQWLMKAAWRELDQQ